LPSTTKFPLLLKNLLHLFTHLYIWSNQQVGFKKIGPIVIGLEFFFRNLIFLLFLTFLNAIIQKMCKYKYQSNWIELTNLHKIMMRMVVIIFYFVAIFSVGLE
jgi:hypothetical protein